VRTVFDLIWIELNRRKRTDNHLDSTKCILTFRFCIFKRGLSLEEKYRKTGTNSTLEIEKWKTPKKVTKWRNEFFNSCFCCTFEEGKRQSLKLKYQIAMFLQSLYQEFAFDTEREREREKWQQKNKVKYQKEK
jgi:hypothetical protein